MNRVFLSGNIGQVPQIKYTQSGFAILEFSVATRKGVKNKEGKWEDKTTWHNIKVLGKRAEALSKYLDQGSKVVIEGEIEVETWEKSDGSKGYKTVILANHVEFFSKSESKRDSKENYEIASNADFASDDIPF